MYSKNHHNIIKQLSSNQNHWPTLVAQLVKNLLAMQETWVRSLAQEDSLENGMATHSSILVGKFHGQRSLARHSLWDYICVCVCVCVCIHIYTYIYMIYIHDLLLKDKYKEWNAVFSMLPSVYNKVTKNIICIFIYKGKNQTKIIPCQWQRLHECVIDRSRDFILYLFGFLVFF